MTNNATATSGYVKGAGVFSGDCALVLYAPCPHALLLCPTRVAFRRHICVLGAEGADNSSRHDLGKPAVPV
jgi:hypothetical protein